MSYVKLSKEDWRQKYNEARKDFMRKYNLSAGQVGAPLSKQDVRGMSTEEVKAKVRKSAFGKSAETSEYWRQRYNEARKEFMRKYNLAPKQVAQSLSKRDIRGMSAEQVKDMKSLFTRPMAKTEKLESGEKISRSAKEFQIHLIEGNINPSREKRRKALQDSTFYTGGIKTDTTVGEQQHLPKYKEFEPLKEREYKSLKDAQKHMKGLKRKIYDPTREEHFKENLLKAIYRSGMSDQDKYDIAMKIKGMSAAEVSDTAMTHEEFELDYVYSEVEGENDERAALLRSYLGITDYHYDEGLISGTEKGFYEGRNTKAGKSYYDKYGNVLSVNYDKNKVEAKKHGKNRKR